MTTTQDVRARYHELLLGPHRSSVCDMVASLPDGNRTLSPHVIERQTYDRACAAATSVTRALNTAADHLRQSESLRRQLGVGPAFEALVRLDLEHGEYALCVRLDGFIGRDGVLRFIENNGRDPRGSPAFQRSHASLPIWRDLEASFRLTPVAPYSGAVAAVIDSHRARGGSGAPTIAAVTRLDKRGEIGGPWLLDVARDEGWRVIRAEPTEVVYRGTNLEVHGERVDIVDVDPFSVLDAPQTIRPILDAVRDGVARLPFGLSRGVSDNKSVFEMLSAPDYAHLYDDETRRALAAHIPWTRVLRERKTTYDGREVDLVPFVVEHRERFVIKPTGAQSGAGVVLGWECTEAAWARAIKISRTMQSIVQERADPGLAETYYFLDEKGQIGEGTFTADFNPFVWNSSNADGALSRIARSGLHNTGAGAWLTPICILEP